VVIIFEFVCPQLGRTASHLSTLVTMESVFMVASPSAPDVTALANVLMKVTRRIVTVGQVTDVVCNYGCT